MRERTVRLRVRSEEREDWERRAKEAGQDLSKWIRARCAGETEKPKNFSNGEFEVGVEVRKEVWGGENGDDRSAGVPPVPRDDCMGSIRRRESDVGGGIPGAREGGVRAAADRRDAEDRNIGMEVGVGVKSKFAKMIEKQSKSKDKGIYCPHGIMKGGTCTRCRGGIGR